MAATMSLRHRFRSRGIGGEVAALLITQQVLAFCNGRIVSVLCGGCNNSWCDGEKQLALFNGVANGNMHERNCTINFTGNGMFHFHRFNNDEIFAC